ncbi:hypothetical protein [Amycolatopsis alba]|uniref:hypothetical protein n=1 Tax=Amycolatopsis alba TaxID=76020 RepID=UPI00117768C2|nr:hypothetical protein [Amycolatopsis alba]
MQSAFDHCGAKMKSVRGKWLTSMPSNLNTFNAAIRAEKTFEQAAFEPSPEKLPRNTASPQFALDGIQGENADNTPTSKSRSNELPWSHAGLDA